MPCEFCAATDCDRLLVTVKACRGKPLEPNEIVVRQAPEGALGAGTKVALQQDELLICDLRLVHGQGQILDADIDLGRRQAFIFAEGDAVAVESGTWNTLQPLVETVQAALDETDAELTDHFTGAARRHPRPPSRPLRRAGCR